MQRVRNIVLAKAESSLQNLALRATYNLVRIHLPIGGFEISA